MSNDDHDQAGITPNPHAGAEEAVFRFFWFTGKWPATFSALRHRNFQLFWYGQLISLIGTWMQNTVQGWLVYSLAVREYGRADALLYVGLISALGSLPMLLFTLFAGVVADRGDKRRIIIATQFCSMVLAFAFAVLSGTGMIRLWHVAVLSTLLGLVNAFDMPTRQAFVKDMVGPRDLLNAIALNSSIFNGARIIGPAIAGSLLAIPGIGIAGAFYINGASYLAVLAGLLAIRLAPHPAAVSNANIWQHMGEGFRYVLAHRTIRLLLVVMGFFSVFGFSYIVLMPVIARAVLHVGPKHYGWLLAMGGAGALIGTLLLASFAGRVCKGCVLLYGSLLFAVSLVAFSLSRNFWLSGIILMFISGGLVVSSASINSLIQEIVPDVLRGRVVSMWAFIFAGFTPLGSLYMGTVARLTSSPAPPIMFGGIICLLAIGVLYWRANWVWRLP